MTSVPEHEPDHHPGRVDPDDVDWDANYRDAERRWSGQVNGSLVVEIEGHPRGRALDVGCGEGADAIWLAEQGWMVTAVDIAPTAVARGAEAAAERGLVIDFRAVDLLVDRPTSNPFDLVSLQYPGFPIDRLDDVVETLTAAVAPGGTLLIVGHAPHPSPEDAPFVRDEWVQAEDIVAKLDAAWKVEVHETRPRPGEHHRQTGAHDMDDVIVRARRTG